MTPTSGWAGWSSSGRSRSPCWGSSSPTRSRPSPATCTWSSFTLIVFGILLGIADRTARSIHDLGELTVRDGIVYGFCQALALIPGVSRSGATITAGLFMGYTREAATRYAFLLAIPAVLASGFYQALDIGSDPAVAWGPTILATIIAFVIGYAVIAWLIRYVSTNSYMPFVIYRIALGTLVLVLLTTGVLENA